jgi:hypothetical protein
MIQLWFYATIVIKGVSMQPKIIILTKFKRIVSNKRYVKKLCMQGEG